MEKQVQRLQEALIKHYSILAGLAVLIRLLLVVYGSWQDEHFEVKYSDIDYAVVTDGAHYVHEGGSPYARTTYRYSPLLAYLLLPNITFHPAFGKLVFVGFDILAAMLVRSIMIALGRSQNQSTLAVLAWLWNPLSMTISTRGSGDSIVCAQVLLTVLGLVKCKLSGNKTNWSWLIISAVTHGLSVHWRIYPIIFAPTILVFMDTWSQRIVYGGISGTVFLSLGVCFYLIYGQEFLHETFLYHVGRTDHRHNFSIWFYALYLAFESERGAMLSLAAFLPQVLTQSAIIWRFGKLDVCFSFMLQTWAFVAFNKVVTAQYFLWYVSLLPVTFFSLEMSIGNFVCTILLPWMVTELHWLLWGYQVEFLGNPRFLGIFGASALFFIVNVTIIARLISWHRSDPSKDHVGSTKKRF